MTLAERRRAKYKKYAASPKGKARAQRYMATAKGQAAARRTHAKSNGKRLHIGRQYMGRANTVEEAAVIKRHIKDRLNAFIAGQQARAEAQGLSASAVSAEAEPGSDRLGRRRVNARNRSVEKRAVSARITARGRIRHRD